jgi:hypothetical protein
MTAPRRLSMPWRERLTAFCTFTRSNAQPRQPLLVLFSLDLVRLTILAVSALTLALAACDNTFHDFSYMWADKVHADSPSGSCVAYVEEDTTSSSVLLVFQGGSARTMEFSGTRLPIQLRWLDSSTLQIRYPKEIRPTCDDDAVEHVVDCFGPKVRVIPVQI